MLLIIILYKLSIIQKKVHFIYVHQNVYMIALEFPLLYIICALD